MKYQPLIPRFPGSKRLSLKLPGILPSRPVDTVLEPFAGSGAFTHCLLQNGLASNAIVGEADPLVRVIWWGWSYDFHDRVYETIGSWKQYFQENHETAWNALKAVCDCKSSFDSVVNPAAAASLVLRKLTFGGVVRCAANGRLNIRYTNGQLEQLSKWEYKFPPVYPCQVANSAEAAIALAAPPPTRSIAAWVDPPYYLPRAEFGRMSPAYPGHKPHDNETLDVGIRALRDVAELPHVEHLVYSNYSSPEHDELVDAALIGFDVQTTRVGRLDSMHKGNGKPSVHAGEKIWIARRITDE